MSTLKFPDEIWAVFNGHVHNAEERALSVVRARYGLWRNEAHDAVEELEKCAASEGIMAIFDKDPNPVTQLFASACFIFANGLDKEPNSDEHQLDHQAETTPCL